VPGVCQAGGVRRAAHHFFSAALMPVLTVLPHRERPDPAHADAHGTAYAVGGGKPFRDCRWRLLASGGSC